MDKIKKILAPTDLSELSGVGIRYALELASSQKAELTIYHVARYSEMFHDRFSSHMELRPAEEWLRESRALLAKFLEENFADLIPKATVHQEVELGNPVERIVKKAVDDRVDMVVLAIHGGRGERDTPMRMAEEIIHQVPCPVLSVPAQHEGKEPGHGSRDASQTGSP